VVNEIGARAKKILHAVVSEYLATGDAVGSQTITRRYGLDVSAATAVVDASEDAPAQPCNAPAPAID